MFYNIDCEKLYQTVINNKINSTSSGQFESVTHRETDFLTDYPVSLAGSLFQLE